MIVLVLKGRFEGGIGLGMGGGGGFAYEGSGKVDACGAGIGAVEPLGFGEAEEAVAVVHCGPGLRKGLG